MNEHRERTIDYGALADFRYEVRRFLHFAEQAARAAGIAPQQYQALLAIRGVPAQVRATVGLLAERLRIRHHSAVELAGRLERAGWIKRLRSDEDRREVLLQVTKRGESLIGQLSRLHRRELGTAAPKLIEALQFVVGHERKPNSTPPNRKWRRARKKESRRDS
jgi:DNA-binding MarR family transcriptional regulator